MVTATTAEITAYGVNIKGPDGRTIATRRDDLRDAGFEHGINTDEGDDLVEQLGYLAGTWRWQPDGSYYKAVVISQGQSEERQRRRNGGRTDREIGRAAQGAVNLQIARTGKRPSGKPLTPEMREWVREYQSGRRDFSS